MANPCTIKGAGVEPDDERPLPTLAQLSALATEVKPQYRALILLAAFGGLRRGELLGLERRDIDLLHRTVTVRVQRTEDDGCHHLVGAPKTDAGRRTLVLPVALVPEIETHLAEWTPPEPDAPVFVGPRGGPLRIATWKREWTRVRRALDLEGVPLHDLRHLAGTMAAATGASTKELVHRLGHASPRAALRYQHATAERDEAIADGIDRILEASQRDDGQDTNVILFRRAAE